MRLVRRNCPVCTEPYRPDESLLRRLPRNKWEMCQFQKGAGCTACAHTSIQRTRLGDGNVDGRGESSRCDPGEASDPPIGQIAVADGLQTLWVKGMRRVMNGETTLEELMRVIGMERVLKPCSGIGRTLNCDQTGLRRSGDSRESDHR